MAFNLNCQSISPELLRKVYSLDPDLVKFDAYVDIGILSITVIVIEKPSDRNSVVSLTTNSVVGGEASADPDKEQKTKRIEKNRMNFFIKIIPLFLT